MGKVRHLQAKLLWVQRLVNSGQVLASKVLGTENPSDRMTKHVDAKLLGDHVRSMGCEFMDGRAELAPQVVQNVEDFSDNHVDDAINLCEDDGGSCRRDVLSQARMTTGSRRRDVHPMSHRASS